MTQFDERERAFENKFAHDQEMMFRAMARRNKMAGHWAAELLGKKGEEAEEYAMNLVRADIYEINRGDLATRLAADLGHRIDESEIRAKIAEFHARAKAELLSEAD